MRGLVWLVIALLLVVSLVGCGGGTMTVTDGEDVDVAGTHFNITLPIEIAPRSASAMTLTLDGSAFEPGLSANVSVEGTTADFAPNWPAGELAFAVYRFNLEGFSGEERVQLTWDGDGPSGDELWVGFSDWSANCWSWFPCDATGTLNPGGDGYADFIDAGTGDMLVALVILGSEEVVVSGVEAAHEFSAPISITGITPDPADGGAGDSIGFDVLFTGTNDMSTTFAWDFGGGAVPNTSADQAPTVELGSGGDYDCSVTVDNDYGDADTYDFTLTVVDSAQGGWWCFGYDQANTRQCPFTGPQIGNVKWTFQTMDCVSGAVAVATDGTVYFGTFEGIFYALNPDGTEKWSYTTGDAIMTSPAIAMDGTVYTGSEDDKLYAFNPDGTSKWELDLPENSSVMHSPVLGPDGAIYVVLSNNDISVINPDSSERLCITHLSPSGGLALGTDGTMYITCIDGMAALDSAGDDLWFFGFSDMATVPPAIAGDGTIYMQTWESLFAINPDGTEEWSIAVAAVGVYTAVATDGTILCGGTDNFLRAYHPSGLPKWTFEFDDYTKSAPAIDADGTIYIGGGRGKGIYGITSDGTQLWKYPTTDSVYNPAVIAPDGTLYIGCADAKLYAFGPND